MQSIFFKHIIPAILALLLASCNSSGSLTKQEIQAQNAADEQVALILFEHELDTEASYNVHKDGFVVIKFKSSVPESLYTQVVDKLRNKTEIKGVRAFQGGRGVCILTQGK